MAARAIKLAIGDCLLTFMWVFCAATLGASTSVIAGAIGVKGPITLLITTSLVATLVFIFSAIGELLGGASFNPTGTAAFYAAGFSKESLFSMALRFPAQAAGAVGGALAIKEVMPEDYKHMLGGPSLKVDLHTGAIAEGVLTFLITLAVLTIIVKVPGGMLVKTWLLSMATVTLVVTGSSYTGPSMNPANAAGAVGGALAIKEVMPEDYKHMLGGPSLKVDLHTGAIAEGVLTFLITLAVLTIIVKVPGGMLVKTWLLSMATVTLVVTGSSYTGPSMNPANAFGWAYVNNRHDTWEQFYVYWICPFIGAIMAAMVFRFIFPQPKKKQPKKSRKVE